ncbi:MAG: aminotransferase class I/II-fold pyridoxal phosphate-dependent enzyme [Planctomycetota bacterium]|nr:aminotransferase class I/II-fold pyridoxal phosphate-dependent enzyme [Planctomycetota bacterium]
MVLPQDDWIADRTCNFDSSGIRKMFDLAAKLEDPINLSIGQPDFDVPDPIKQKMVQAVQDGFNGYALTQGIPTLRGKLQEAVDLEYGDPDRKVFVCSGTSGGLFLAALAMINPGDEVIFFDPYFVMYPALVELVGGVPVKLSSYPDFQIDVAAVEEAITEKTKMIIVNSPSNPTGVCYSEDVVREVAELAHRKGICLVSDEIYSRFSMDHEHLSPAKYNKKTVVIDGFSKTYAMTGWRVAYVHGPSEIIDTMIKIQQYTFVCAPHPAQVASVHAMDVDITPYIDTYRQRRDFMVEELKNHYEIVKPGGAFYLFPKLPWGNGQQFVERAIENNLMIIPGNIFSDRDTHFRISYAVSDEMLERGIDVLKRIAAC